MWLLYSLLHMFFMALVNYIDEYLTHSSTSKSNVNIHERIGGVLIISTFMCVLGLAILYLLPLPLNIASASRNLALLSAIPMVIVWAGYFYMLQLFSTHHVVPLFGLSSIWLLGLELLGGATIMPRELLGIAILVCGAYILDRGSFKWGIPSRLLLLMLPISGAWAITVFIIKLATQDTTNEVAVYFWQLLGILFIGFVLFTFYAPYRRGFMNRIQKEKSRFIVPSLINEGAAQISFLCGVLAIAAAPLATYFTAVGGLQSIFLIALFWLFPLDKRNKTTPTQWLGIAFIAAGIALLEI